MKLPTIEEEDLIWLNDYAHAHPVLAGRLTRIAERLASKGADDGLREALIEATTCLTWIASLGYEGVPDIAMRRAAKASLEHIAALSPPQATGSAAEWQDHCGDPDCEDCPPPSGMDDQL